MSDAPLSDAELEQIRMVLVNGYSISTEQFDHLFAHLNAETARADRAEQRVKELEA